jgi:hypothetical protein
LRSQRSPESITPILGIEWVLVPELLKQHNYVLSIAEINDKCQTERGTLLRQGYGRVKFFKFKKKNVDNEARRFSPSFGVIPCGITHSIVYILANKKSPVKGQEFA